MYLHEMQYPVSLNAKSMSRFLSVPALSTHFNARWVKNASQMKMFSCVMFLRVCEMYISIITVKT